MSLLKIGDKFVLNEKTKREVAWASEYLGVYVVKSLWVASDGKGMYTAVTNNTGIGSEGTFFEEDIERYNDENSIEAQDFGLSEAQVF